MNEWMNKVVNQVKDGEVEKSIPSREDSKEYGVFDDGKEASACEKSWLRVQIVSEEAEECDKNHV